jgi:hypothetical protein
MDDESEKNPECFPLNSDLTLSNRLLVHGRFERFAA